MAMEALRIAAKESKFMKFILGGFIFLAVGGLVLTDVNGSFSGGIGNTTVARVGDTKIDIRDFDSQLRLFLQQTGLTAEEAYEAGLIDTFLNARVNSLLQLHAAQDLNLKLDNKSIAGQLSQIFPGATKDQIEMTLRAQGISEAELANQIRAQAISRITSALPLGVSNTLPNYMVKAHEALQAERRSGVIYTTPLSAVAGDIQITDADIQSYYNDNIEQFTLPEERQFIIGKMTLDMAKKGLPAITAADVRAEYDDNQDDYLVPETRKIAQAQFDNPDEAQAVYEAVMNGASLKDALKTVTGSEEGYISAQSYTIDGLLNDLADAAFKDSIKKGDVTPPVKTLLGNVVMQIESITPEMIKPFASVQSDIQNRLNEFQIHDALYNKMMDAEDAIDRGESFDEIVKKIGLTTSTTSFLTKERLIEATGDLKAVLESSPSMVDEIFNLSQEGASYPTEIDENSFIIIGIKSLKPTTILPIDDVKKDIETSLRSNRLNAMAQSVADDIVKRLNDGALSVDEAVKTYGLSAKEYKNIKRDDESDHAGLIFSTAKGKYGFTNDDSNIVIATVSATSKGDNKPLGKDKKQEIINAQQTFIDSLLNDFYRDNITIKINNTLLKRTYSRDPVQ